MTPQRRVLDSTLQILGFPIFGERLEGLVNLIVNPQAGADAAEGCLLISATGAHGLSFASTHPGFADVLRSFSCLVPDGMPLVWVGRLKGGKRMERCYGPTLFQMVMEKSSPRADMRHFFCGGKPGVADELKRAVEKNFGNSHCVGTYCPPFRTLTDQEWSELSSAITASGANIVWIGLSTPKQEAFARELARHVSVHAIITIGAAFDFHTGKVQQAPSWIQHAGLEWLFRLVMEPRRLIRRYAVIVPHFMFLAAKDLWQFYFGQWSTAWRG